MSDSGSYSTRAVKRMLPPIGRDFFVDSGWHAAILTSAMGVAHVVSALTLVALVIVAGPAAADWSEPFVADALEAASEHGPRVAVDGAGNAIFSWLHSRDAGAQVRARVRSATSGRGGLETVSGDQAAAIAPRVAMNAAGTAVFAWRNLRQGTVEARVRSAAGTYGAIVTLGSVGVQDGAVEVAIDPNGNAVFAWEVWNGAVWRIDARRLEADGQLGTHYFLTAPTSSRLGAVGADAAGNAFIAYVRYDATGSTAAVRVRILTASDELQPPVALSGYEEVPPATEAPSPQLAVDAGGNASIVWVTRNVAGSDDRISLRTLSVSGVLGRRETVAAGNPFYQDARAAVDADGDAVFGWMQRDPDGEWRIMARSRSAAGVKGAIRTLARLPQGRLSGVGVNPGGDAVFGWMRNRGDGLLQLQARERFADETLGPIDTLARGPVVHRPQLAVGAGGTAAIVYQDGEGNVVGFVGP